MANNKYRKIFKFILKLSLILIALSIVIFLCYYITITDDATLNVSKLPLSYQNISIFDRFNNDITAKYYSNIVLPDEIPDNIKMAFLITEDREFYKHNGIDYHRLIGAFVNNLKHHDLSQGGSTITQQLVKNTHLSSDKNLDRKLKEFKIAKQIENNFTKDEILAMYLNILYFGNGIYGIKNASKVFFDKEIDKLNIAEACMLAGIVKNPSKYSPIIDYNKSSKRKELILNLLYINNKIDEQVLYNQINYRINIVNNRQNNNYLNSYLTNAIYETKLILGLNAKEKLPKDIKIYTNVDLSTQKSVMDIVENKKGVVKNDYGNYPNNALCVFDNSNSKIIAFGSDYKTPVFNVNRQMGSLVKPFVYLNALENKKINVCTPILDEPIDIDGYKPNNFNNVFHGYVNMRESLKHSYNIPAVKVLNEVGLENTKKFLDKLNFNISSKDGLAIALGGFTKGDNLINIGASYVMLANNGIYQNPSFINRIIIDNHVLYSKNTKTKVCSPANAYIITDCLKDVVKDGTLKKLNYLQYELAGKTGTVASMNGNSDSYSVAYNSLNTIISWQGNLSNKSNNGLPNYNTGGSYPANQIALVLDEMYTSYPANFEVPNGIIEEKVDNFTLEKFHEVKIASKFIPEYLSKWEIFSVDNIPIEYSTLFDDLSNFNVKIVKEDKKIIINVLNDNMLVNYDIYKTIFNKKILIDTIKSDNNIKQYIDNANIKYFKYNYIITPYIYDDNNKKIYLTSKYIKIDSN